MKAIVFSLFFLIATKVNSQSYYPEKKETGVAVGLGGGYSSLKSVIGNYTIGAMIEKHNHVSINLQIFGRMKEAEVPVIGELRVGHVFGTYEIYGGYGYHLASTDGNNKYIIEKVNGFKPAFGVIKYFYKNPLYFSAGMSGRIFSIQVGIFGVR